MGFLLLEAQKRDELLNVYHELVKSKGVDVPFGYFKSILLEHLTQNGGLRNLSLASNYYLAGAARYYFNGDLTENKDLALFFPYTPNARLEAAVNNGEQVQPNHTDIWREDVCAKLNKIILLLRNAYIDTLGETWEQPEDFGKLSIKQLFAKYGKKTEKLKDNSEEDDEFAKINRSTNVGNGYTFDIMYSHEDCKKYYNATSPGAWCITYGQGHYDGYVRRLDIHYVVFRKDGWESVPRVPEKDKWVRDNTGYYPKPQDDYGNSLICVLQSNRNGQPVYITSRWNHGAGDCGSVEADHAYTKEEFMNITGVSNDDLMRIFEIWQKTANIKRKSSKDISTELKEVVRKLKEFQMRINTGGNFAENAQKFSVSIVKSVTNVETDNFSELSQNVIKKMVCVAKIEDPTGLYYFIFDKFKIIFESITPLELLTEGQFITEKDYPQENARIKNSIIISTKRGCSIYNTRMHSFVDVAGEKRFKRVPLPDDCSQWNYANADYMFYEVKKSRNDIALIDNNTGKPLRLPNGEYWVNEVPNAYTGYESGNRLHAHLVGHLSNPVIELIYDLSSLEKYFYNCVQRQFVTFEYNLDFRKKGLTQADAEPIIKRFDTNYRGVGTNTTNCLYGVGFKDKRNRGWYGGSDTPINIFDAKTNKKLSIFGLDCFRDASISYVPLLRINVYHMFDSDYYDIANPKKAEFFKSVFPDGTFLYDTMTHNVLAINNIMLEANGLCENNGLMYIDIREDSALSVQRYRWNCQYVIYNLKNGMFVENETGFPTRYSFLFNYINKYDEFKDGLIGYYEPSEEVHETDDYVTLPDSWNNVKKGCEKLYFDKLKYFPPESRDIAAEYNILFGNENENIPQENGEMLNEDIEFMVRAVLENIRNKRKQLY